MSSFEEIIITGIDLDRPPQVRKESYIDLYYKISIKAPTDWSEDFNALGRQLSPAAKIGKTTADCIDTYANDMEKIPSQLNEIKQTVKDCNEQYMEKIKQKAMALAASNAAQQGQGGEQDKLNQIIAALAFDS
jgi:hypothetical protein